MNFIPNTSPTRKAPIKAAMANCSMFSSTSTASAAQAIMKTLLAMLLCLNTITANAGSKPQLGWACWLSEKIPASIKCIRDRSMMQQNMMDDEESALRNLQPDMADNPDDEFGKQPQDMPDITGKTGIFPGKPRLSQLLEEDEPENEIEAEVLNEIYSRILMGDTAGLDSLVARHIGSLRENSVLTIDIYTPPVETSWRENQPAKIVRSALCPKNSNCRVILNKPDY